MMTPTVMELQHHYSELSGPVIILAGGDDQIVDVGRHSERLHNELPDSELILIPGAGHMVHHLAPEQIVDAVGRAGSPPPPTRTPFERAPTVRHASRAAA